MVLASPVPAIAAVDGVCVGGALEFAASCDLRLCTNRVRLLCPEVGIGLVASNAGTLLLPEVLGETAARELLLGGEERDAGWARERGFATELVAPAEPGRADRALGGGLLAQLARRGRGDQGDAQRALRRRCWSRPWSARPTTACACSRSSDARKALGGFAERRASP